SLRRELHGYMPAVCQINVARAKPEAHPCRYAIALHEAPSARAYFLVILPYFVTSEHRARRRQRDGPVVLLEHWRWRRSVTVGYWDGGRIDDWFFSRAVRWFSGAWLSCRGGRLSCAGRGGADIGSLRCVALNGPILPGPGLSRGVRGRARTGGGLLRRRCRCAGRGRRRGRRYGGGIR